MTGAPVPAGCEGGSYAEQTEQTDDGVRLPRVRCRTKHPATPAGIFTGDAVNAFPAGTRLESYCRTAGAGVAEIADARVVRKVARSAVLDRRRLQLRASRWRRDKFMTLTV